MSIKKKLTIKVINKFWKTKTNKILWYKKPNNIIEKNKNKFLFYQDGTTNVALNCLKKKNPDLNKIAVIFIDKFHKKYSLSYEELGNVCNYFIQEFKKETKAINLNNQIVAIHSSANLCSVVSMLSCAKMGVTFSVLFEDLPLDAIKIRLKLLKTKILITSADDLSFNKKILPLAKELKIKIIRFNNNIRNRPLSFVNVLKNKNFTKKFSFKEVNSNKKLFILFTSGSTGVPKGVVNSSGGYLLYSKLSCIKKFNMNKNSIVITASDAGWINGHTYALFGPLSLGATTVILEKPLDILNETILKKILFEIKTNILYLPVTLIRLLKSIKLKKMNSPYLKVLGSMGEPLSKSTANWFGKKFSKNNLPIINTYFQTETGGIICSPDCKAKPFKKYYGSVGYQLFNELNVFIDKENKNEIKIKNPWPGCMIDVLNDKNIWKNYFDKDNNFRLFDHGFIDNEKKLFIQGRIDDVINIRGHRIGTGEIEQIIIKNKKVIECCVIAVDDKIEGSRIVVFISSTKKININDIEKKIIDNFGLYAKPKHVFIVKDLPKTRSGKILRRVLRNITKNPYSKNFGDISTILHKKSLLLIQKKIQNVRN